MGSLVVSSIAHQHSNIVKRLKKFDPVYAAATFSSLFLSPELQSSCVRLEALVHMALTYGCGTARLQLDDARKWFSELKSGMCGLQEDPAENLFSSTVLFLGQNYRVLLGIFESADFHLQRSLNVIETLPNINKYNALRQSVVGLLRLSESAISETGSARYTVGNDIPAREIPYEVRQRFNNLKTAIEFSKERLHACNVRLEALSPFLFNIANREVLSGEALGNSSLERRPLILHEEKLYLLMPAAISPAIRRYIIEFFLGANLKEQYEKNLALEYSRLFYHTLILGELRHTPVFFENNQIAEVATEIDDGVYLQLIFLADSLQGYEDGGLNGIRTIFCGDKIQNGQRQLSQQENFRRGITLIVGCGWGRSVKYQIPNADRHNWLMESISAADLMTLSWYQEFDALRLLRIIDAERALLAADVHVANHSGILNLIGWADQNEGHLVPHAEIPESFGGPGSPVRLMIGQNYLQKIRLKVADSWDVHFAYDANDAPVRVRREASSNFEEDAQRPLYISDDALENGVLHGVYESATRYWWAEVTVTGTDEVSRNSILEFFRMLCSWLPRAAPKLEKKFSALPKTLRWIVEIIDYDLTSMQETPPEIGQLRDLIDVSVSEYTVHMRLKPGFEFGFSHPQNIAERVIVECFVKAIIEIAGESISAEDYFKLIAEIIPDADARHIHRFYAQEFRDYIAHRLPRELIAADELDDAMFRVGLGWRVRDRKLGGEITGRDECTKFANSLVTNLEEALTEDISKFERKSLLRMLITNYECGMRERNVWRRTSRALMSLHDDKSECLKVIVEKENRRNGVFISSRALIELALCESKMDVGYTPNTQDIARLLVRMTAIMHLGGWSDAIRYEAMEPKLIIRPLGDVHANVDFFDEVVGPFSELGNEKQVEHAMEVYEKQYSIPCAQERVGDLFDREFVAAWQEEFGFSIDDVRGFLTALEDFALDKDTAIIELSLSELVSVCDGKHGLAENVIKKIVEALKLEPRKKWKELPMDFVDADRQPWRYRRRLSLLRRPLLQLDNSDNPQFLAAPGIIREAFIYMLSSYSQGNYSQSQATTRKMKQWLGKVNDINGRKFTQQVHDQLSTLGWSVKKEVNVSEILGRSLAQNFGDVDVLAWNSTSGRVLLIECKDLRDSKTPREIAEQLYDFRGETGKNGQRDTLKRHLDRIEILEANSVDLRRYLNIKKCVLEGHLVFKQPVPMQFAWQRMENKVRLTVFDNLHRI